MNTLKKLFFLLSRHERKQAGILLVMIIIMALLDMIGVASILPFIAVLTNPSLIETNIFLNNLFQISKEIGIDNNQQFIFALGISVFILLIISLAFKALTSYFQIRFVQMREFSIGKRLIEGYLHQPYSWFLNRHSADLGKLILSEVSTIISGGLSPVMELIAKSFVIVALISLLIIVDPKLALIVGICLIGSYSLIFYFIRQYLKKIGQERLKNNQLRYLALSEAFGASKEVKLGGLEKTYVNFFSNAAKSFARTQASSQVLALLPRFILEAIAFGGILLVILYIISKTGNFTNALPILSLYVFAGYRLMPALQQLYISFTQLAFTNPTLDKLYEDLKSLKFQKLENEKRTLLLNDKITLKNISYKYPHSSQNVLKNISLNINSKSTVGFIGPTGSGKTTVVDIILGLLEPQSGSLKVDENIIDRQNLRAWQRNIGYVPQHIYLSDDTIAANIAFGVKVKDINQEIVEKVSKISNIHDFIKDELPKQYQTTIGERGIRLSGGQRQRIAIARALYHNPKVLILDEATSALDNQTEQAVMDAVNNLSKDITIILIAHRLNTVKNCENIFKLEKGQIVAQGSFEELIEKNYKLKT
ncbi:ABC transporter ATP-binding protein/permease [Candidatus Pelagibacter sp.]|nr:ABC transporter ATP-binding protein/permease [Candidatus Pelagibacter sp.]